MLRRLVWAAVFVGAALFTLLAGEFSTFDILTQRRTRRALQAGVDSLQREVDSLTRVERAVRTDPATQERIAREEFGMVRGDKELLYRFATPPDTTRPDTTRAR